MLSVVNWRTWDTIPAAQQATVQQYYAANHGPTAPAQIIQQFNADVAAARTDGVAYHKVQTEYDEQKRLANSEYEAWNAMKKQLHAVDTRASEGAADRMTATAKTVADLAMQ